MALGIASVEFTISGAASLPGGIRVGMTQVNAGGTEFESNAFILQGGPTTRVDIASFARPFWSKLPAEARLDTSQLNDLRFQVVVQPGASFDYDYCVSDVTWLDATGSHTN